jgi:hypothetical protein
MIWKFKGIFHFCFFCHVPKSISIPMPTQVSPSCGRAAPIARGPLSQRLAHPTIQSSRCWVHLKLKNEFYPQSIFSKLHGFESIQARIQPESALAMRRSKPTINGGPPHAFGPQTEPPSPLSPTVVEPLHLSPLRRLVAWRRSPHPHHCHRSDSWSRSTAGRSSHRYWRPTEPRRLCRPSVTHFHRHKWVRWVPYIV